MALPGPSSPGLYLALATMAFARMAEFVIFDQPEVFGNAGRRMPPLKIFGFGFNDRSRSSASTSPPTPVPPLRHRDVLRRRARRGLAPARARSGGAWSRMRDSPAACATLGVNLFSTKLAVFAISAANRRARRRARRDAPRLGGHVRLPDAQRPPLPAAARRRRRRGRERRGVRRLRAPIVRVAHRCCSRCRRSSSGGSASVPVSPASASAAAPTASSPARRCRDAGEAHRQAEARSRPPDADRDTETASRRRARRDAGGLTSRGAPRGLRSLGPLRRAPGARARHDRRARDRLGHRAHRPERRRARRRCST